jgi:hypothetical protein
MVPAVKPDIRPRIEYRVGMHSPGLMTYPLWARLLIRLVYFITGYQVTPHDVGIAETEEEADSWCLDTNYFYKPLYVGLPLPEEGAGPGPVVWPRLKEAKGLYEKHCPDLVTLTRPEFEALQGAVNGLCHSR